MTKTTNRPVKLGDPLTIRERTVLAGMARGRSNAEIAQDLDLCVDTVKTHAWRLFAKLGVHNRAAAVGAGFRRGLLLVSVLWPVAGEQR